MTATTTTPSWLRGLRIIFGVIGIGASIFVLGSPGVAIYTLVLLLSLAMIMIGCARLARGFSNKLFSKPHRVIDVIAGVFGIIFGFAAIAFPLMGAVTLIFLLAIATMVNGFGSIGIGSIGTKLPKWVRAFFIIAGLLAVAFAFIVFAAPAIGAITLVWLLSISLMIHGIESIISAIQS